MSDQHPLADAPDAESFTFPSERPADGTVVALIRHGQTDWNLEGRLQGSSDIPLNEHGRLQAAAAIRVLRKTGVTWDAIVSSPMERARMTAEIIAEGLGIELGPSYPDLLERDYGPLEGVSEALVEQEWPGKSHPEVEKLGSVVARGRRALDTIQADYPGSDVIVVAHGTIIRYTLADVVGHPVDAILNGAVSAVSHDDSGWRVLRVNGRAVD